MRDRKLSLYDLTKPNKFWQNIHGPNFIADTILRLMTTKPVKIIASLRKPTLF